MQGSAVRQDPPLDSPRRLARSPTEVTNCKSPRACLGSGFFFWGLCSRRILRAARGVLVHLLLEVCVSLPRAEIDEPRMGWQPGRTLQADLLAGGPPDSDLLDRMDYIASTGRG